MGLRVVNANWGPRGFAASFFAARRHGFQPATVIDIGASNGKWARECQSIFPRADYFLIDPIPDNESHLRRFAAGRPNVAYWCGALGASDGYVDIYLHGDQSSVLRSKDFQGEALAVQQRTLDGLAREKKFRAPLLIKADAQGFELEILRGATECLNRCDMLLLELSIQRLYEGSCVAHEVISYLGEFGFQLFDVTSYVQRPHDQLLAQMDVVFVTSHSKLVEHIGWES